MEQIDNPPAFPDPMRAAEQSIINQSPYELSTGMLLRDYFAAKAMQGLLPLVMFGSPATNLNAAKDAYALADALLKARKETKTE
jgi:hypothetical protein